MRKITKVSTEPNLLTVYKTNNPRGKYEDLKLEPDAGAAIRTSIREQCVEEQHYLCAYCCCRISAINTSSHNEHIVSQNSQQGATLTLDMNNIVASCNTKKQCGDSKANQIIQLTPLLNECEVEIKYQQNGKMTYTTPRAQQAISRLNLNHLNKRLVSVRKDIIDSILFNYLDDNNLALEEDEYLSLIMDELQTPDREGKLEAYSPIVVNILKNYI